nr:unnamed protein product [Spirometra erinaceieuropaei]
MAHRPRNVLSKVERDALRELKADKELVIVPADKGRSTVVLDRAAYLQKAKGLLEDLQFYAPCATNPVKALTREINATLLALENSGAITPTDRRMAKPQDTALARFYGLPKVHKDGAPLRPLMSHKGTPTYGLAKWLFRRLKFLTAESDTTVSSLAEFLEKLKGDLAIKTIELLLQSKYDETENRLGCDQVLQLLKFCLRTYFTFDGTIYEQVKGTPMGSPISGFITEAVLQRLESLVFQHHKPKFWARYVDDTFVVIDRGQLLTFKERLNTVFPDKQFTMEEEENNQLTFLDVLVCRKDCGGLKTKVFRKAANTMQVLNSNSNRPISHKRSCVRTLYRRVETHCSEPEDKIAELQYLRRVFKANGYPRNFVNRNELAQRLDNLPIAADTAAAENASVENRWCQLRDTVQSTALAVLGRAPRQHQDWFDDNDAAIRNLLAEKNRLHKAYVDHPTDATKAAFYRSRRHLQQRLREMQDAWTARKAEEIQGYANRNEWENFFTAIKAVYGPPMKGTAPLLSADGSTLLTEKTQILQRWAEHFRGVLNRPPRHLRCRHCPPAASGDQRGPRPPAISPGNDQGRAAAVQRESTRIGRNPC